jgi:hypothetical protein
MVTSVSCETCILCCLVHICLKTKKELSIGVSYVLIVGLAVPVAGKHVLVIVGSEDTYFPRGCCR